MKYREVDSTKKIQQTNVRNHTVLRKYNRKRIFIKFSLWVLVIVILLSVFVWYKPENAEAVYDFIEVFIPVLFGELLLRMKLKKYNWIAKMMLVLIVATIIIFAEACLAKERVSEPKATIYPEETTDSGVERTYSDAFSWDWEEDPYIVSWASYCDAVDEKAALNKLIESYTKRYLFDDSGVIYKAEDELNSGMYGKCIAAAKPAEDAIDLQIEIEAKLDYTDVAIKWREKADQDYEAHDNKKILGDLYLKKAELITNESNQKTEWLEIALEYYIAALPLAYLRLDPDDSVIKSIWASIQSTYIKLRDMEYGVDAGHKARIPLIISMCDKWCKD